MLSKDLSLSRIEHVFSPSVKSEMMFFICAYILNLEICWTWNTSWKASSMILEILHWNWYFTDSSSAFAFIYIFKFLHYHLPNIFISWLIHDLLGIRLNFIILHGLTFILRENTNHKTFTLFKQKKTYLWQNKSILHHLLRNLASFHHVHR